MSSHLQISADHNERKIVVTLSGTSFGMEFRMTAEGLAPASAPIVEDYNAPMTPNEFAQRAERAAKTMARQLGWLEKPLESTEDE